MNPSDWIMMYQIFVLKADDALKPQIQVFKLLMQNYMYEMGKFDLVAAGKYDMSGALPFRSS